MPLPHRGLEAYSHASRAVSRLSSTLCFRHDVNRYNLDPSARHAVSQDILESASKAAGMPADVL